MVEELRALRAEVAALSAAVLRERIAKTPAMWTADGEQPSQTDPAA